MAREDAQHILLRVARPGGLSMSYDIITQQHGGSISVDSSVGEYSRLAGGCSSWA